MLNAHRATERLTTVTTATTRQWNALIKKLAIRKEENGHAYVTFDEARFLVRNNLYQPGHTVARYSLPAEDLSDEAQR